MALTDDELKQIKEAAEAGLFAKGATGVGLGPIIDETTGALGSEIVIAVLAPDTIPNLPGQISGVKTQLIKVASVEKAEPDEPGLCGEDKRDEGLPCPLAVALVVENLSLQHRRRVG